MIDQKSKNNSKVLVICGPTSTGKTKLALSVASAYPESLIICADSRQAYKDIPVVSGQDVPNNLPKSIKIFGLNIFEPNEPSNIAQYISLMWKVIEDRQNTPVIIVGGSGLYVKALIEPLEDMFVPPDLKLREQLSNKSAKNLQDILEKLNPVKFKQLNQSDINNPRRLIRAIEISQAPKNHFPKKPNFKYTQIGIKPNSKDLEKNITHRVEERIKAGAIEEVGLLLNQYPDRSLPIYSALGIPQIIQYIDKLISIEQLISLWSRAEISYAKRQMVWFKKQSSIIWYHQSDVQDQSSRISQYLS